MKNMKNGKKKSIKYMTMKKMKICKNCKEEIDTEEKYYMPYYCHICDSDDFCILCLKEIDLYGLFKCNHNHYNLFRFCKNCIKKHYILYIRLKITEWYSNKLYNIKSYLTKKLEKRIKKYLDKKLKKIGYNYDNIYYM
jgi:hypothetical protein